MYYGVTETVAKKKKKMKNIIFIDIFFSSYTKIAFGGLGEPLRPNL